MGSTFDVRIVAGTPAHQAAGVSTWVQLRLDPEPGHEWGRRFAKQDLDRCELSTNDSILSVGHDGLSDLQRLLVAVEEAIRGTNESYRAAVERGEEPDDELSAIAEFLMKRYPPKK
jgi:hypothetical protein